MVVNTLTQCPSLALSVELAASLIPWKKKLISTIDLQSSLYETSEVLFISCSSLLFILEKL